MIRFTIRDVLWLMVVVGLAVGWFVERANSSRVLSEKATLLQKLKDTEADRDWLHDLCEKNGVIFRSSSHIRAN